MSGSTPSLVCLAFRARDIRYVCGKGWLVLDCSRDVVKGGCAGWNNGKMCGDAVKGGCA